MNRHFSLSNRLIAVTCFLLVWSVFSTGAEAQNAKEDQIAAQYRQAILKDFGIDIKNFQEGMSGGRADGQKITKYDLDQLLTGIKVELEHTSDRMRALEIAMDHLEEFPDYYTRLEKMEEEAEKSFRKR